MVSVGLGSGSVDDDNLPRVDLSRSRSKDLFGRRKDAGISSSRQVLPWREGREDEVDDGAVAHPLPFTFATASIFREYIAVVIAVWQESISNNIGERHHFLSEIMNPFGDDVSTTNFIALVVNFRFRITFLFHLYLIEPF